MLQKFQKSFSKVIKKSDTLVLAVSGGVDSMVLLDLVSKNHPKEQIIVAHFDHSLRGAESDGDRDFIANFCDRNTLTLESEKLDISKLARDEKTSIENTARKYRYDFLTRVAKKYDVKYILTAHHSDDRIETAVFNLIRGTKLGGIHALSSLKHPKGAENRPQIMLYLGNEESSHFPPILFRPLLGFSKEEILSYAKSNGILFREDSTNSDIRYLRNYVRHEVLPKFEKINPEYRAALSNFIDYSEELKSWIDTEIETFLDGKKQFSALEFEKKSPFFQKEIIRYLYEKINHGTVGLSEGNIEEILRFILSANGGTIKCVQDLMLLKSKNIVSIREARLYEGGISHEKSSE